MSAYCENCGTRLAGSICPNCSEELYIYIYQNDDLPNELSDEFVEKVNEQMDEQS